MPELPDVETFRRFFEKNAAGRRVKVVQVLDRSILKGVSARQLQQRLQHQVFRRGRRYGKYLFGETDTGAVRLHFGMTGFLHAYKHQEERSSHPRVIFAFTNDGYLAFDCRRKIGHVGWVNDVDSFLDQEGLGPDTLAIDLDGFAEVLTNNRRNIKSILMEQSIIAGIGNVYSDEILFRARIHPESRPQNWHHRRIKHLYDAMGYVLEKSIDSQADPARMPRTWLLPHRGKGGVCPRCKVEFEHATVASRSAYFCSQCQKH